MSITRTLRGLILAAIFAMTIALSGAVTTTARADVTGPPTVPTFYDACGTSQDEAWNNGDTQYDYIMYKDGVREGMNPNTPYSTGGAVNVQIDAVNPYTSLVAQSWTQVYDTTAPCGAPAANLYSAAITGSCDPVNNITPATASLLNVQDVYRVYLPAVYVRAVRKSDGFYLGSNDLPMLRILDGMSQTMNMGSFGGGLPSGKWMVGFYSNDSYKPSSLLGTTMLNLPGCDPNGHNNGGNGNASKKKPRGVVHLTNCQTGVIKAYTSTKGLPKGGKTRFKYLVGGAKKPVMVKMKNGVKKPKHKVFRNVPNHKTVRLYYKKGHRWVFLSKDGNFGCGGS